jgi:hypothetical protein
MAPKRRADKTERVFNGVFSMSPIVVAAPLTLPMTMGALLAAVLFGAIGLRCLVAPNGGARFFGVPVIDLGGESFVRAMGARNLGLALTAAALIATGIRAGLASLIAAAAIMAALDAVIVLRAAGLSKAAKHFAYVPVFTAFSLWIAIG